MQQSGGIVEPACPSSERMVTLPARPEPLRLAADQTAVVVIDMQNAYASPGGYVDLAGFDRLSPNRLHSYRSANIGFARATRIA